MKSFKVIGVLVLVLGVHSVYGMNKKVQPIRSIDPEMRKRIDEVNALKTKDMQLKANNYIAQLGLLTYKTPQQIEEGKRIIDMLKKFGLTENVSYQEQQMAEKIAASKSGKAEGTGKSAGKPLSDIEKEIQKIVRDFGPYNNMTQDLLRRQASDLVAQVIDNDNCWNGAVLDEGCVSNNKDFPELLKATIMLIIRRAEHQVYDFFESHIIETRAIGKSEYSSVMKRLVFDKAAALIGQIKNLEEAIDSRLFSLSLSLEALEASAWEGNNPSQTWIRSVRSALKDRETLAGAFLGGEVVSNRMKAERDKVKDTVLNALNNKNVDIADREKIAVNTMNSIMGQ